MSLSCPGIMLLKLLFCLVYRVEKELVTTSGRHGKEGRKHYADLYFPEKHIHPQIILNQCV